MVKSNFQFWALEGAKIAPFKRTRTPFDATNIKWFTVARVTLVTQWIKYNSNPSVGLCRDLSYIPKSQVQNCRVDITLGYGSTYLESHFSALGLLPFYLSTTFT